MQRDQCIELLAKWDRELKTGQGNSVRKQLAKISPSNVPRSLRVQFSKVSRRANLPNLALRFLSHITSTAWQKTSTVTEEEKVEYAASLLRVGAVDEARSLLLPVSKGNSPEAQLYLAFTFVVRSEYAASIPYLKKYLESEKLSEYQVLIGKVNLAAAYVYEQMAEDATALLESLWATLRVSQHHLLISEVLQLRAQHALKQKRFADAREALQEAQKRLEDQEGLTAFFIEKWTAVIGFSEEPNRKNEEVFLQVQEKAKKLKHWESIRDCDFHLAQIKKDHALADRIYCGTPVPSLLKRLQKEMGSNWKTPSQYIWELGDKGANQEFAIADAHTPKMKKPLKPGQFVHRLFLTLASDFYRPWSVGALFSKVCEGEHYHPHFSAQRMYQGVLKLRLWFKYNKLPFDIASEEGGYRLTVKNGKRCQITVTPHLTAESVSTFLQDLSQHFGSKPFTVKEITEKLEVSKWTAIRRLNEAIADGVLQSIKKGPKTTYHFVESGSATTSSIKAA